MKIAGILAIVALFVMALTLGGCAEQRAFNKEVKQDQAQKDYGAGKQP